MSEKECAIKALERMWNYCEEIDNHLPEAEQTGYKMLPDYRVVWAYLKSLPDWIPCSSGVMPRDNDDVIVSIYDDRGDRPDEYTAVGWYGDGHWIVDNEFRYDVVAWMPLPKPYRRERQSGD